MAPPESHSILAPNNHHGLSILANYYLSVSPQHQHQSIQNIDDQQQRPKLMVMPTDRFKFDINAISCLFDSNSMLLVNVTSLFQSCQEIACKTFFQDGQDFLRSHLSHPNIPSRSLDLIIPEIMGRVQQLFGHNLPSDPDIALANPSDSNYRVLPLEVVIVVQYEPYDVMHAVMEESAQGFRMIPASKNAIHSLKKFKLMKQAEYCTICLEEFDVSGDDEGITVLAMPCDHVFHQQCIVQWLQTSHMCPLCRYPMPTANNV